MPETRTINIQDLISRAHVPNRYGASQYGPPRYGPKRYGDGRPGAKRK